jgi:hypothetical protein
MVFGHADVAAIVAVVAVALGVHLFVVFYMRSRRFEESSARITKSIAET